MVTGVADFPGWIKIGEFGVAGICVHMFWKVCTGQCGCPGKAGTGRSADCPVCMDFDHLRNKIIPGSLMKMSPLHVWR